jgi:hypothetical protein
MTQKKNTQEGAKVILRTAQVLCIGLVLMGFVWSTSDLLLNTILVNAPVTPMSVLLMLYGLLGTFGIEAVIRLLNRSFLQRTERQATSG